MAVKEYVIAFQVGDTVLESRIYQAGDVFGDLPFEKGVYHWYLGNGEEILPTDKVPSENTTVWGSTFALRITQPIALNVSTDSIVPVLHMVQGDSNSRTITATLWDGASPFTPSGAAMLRFRKPDGTGGLYDTSEGGESITTFRNGVSIPVAAQMLAVEGTVYCELDFYAGGAGVKASRLATFRFLVDVEASAYPDAQIISSDYYNVLASDIADAKTAAANAQKSAAAAAESAASAATSVEGAVKYNVAQVLTPVQRVQAQQNIGVTWACNPNIFDNPDYAVNQRGITSLPAGSGYYADRWSKYGSATTGIVAKGNVHIINSGASTFGWQQRMEADRLIAGMTYTMSFLLKPISIDDLTNIRLSYGNTLDNISGSINLPADTPLNAWTAFSYTFTLPESSDGFYNFRIRTTAVPCEFEIGPGKLELGSVQTLAHQDSSGAWVLNEIPDYAEQLRRCQRYLYIQKTNTRFIASGLLTAAKTAIFFGVTVPVPMRALPTLLAAPSVFQVRTTTGGNVDPVVSEVSVYSDSPFDTVITLRAATETFNADGYINNTPLSLFVKNLQLSAEL